METNHTFVGTDNIIQDGSSNSCSRTTLNDQLLVENDILNIATMSDFQFSESLDALIDAPYTENVATTKSQSTLDVPSCFDVDEAALTKPQVATQQQQEPLQQIQQQPIAVIDNSHNSFSGISSVNNTLQQSTTSLPFFPNMMMPIAFDPNTFFTAAATTTNNNTSFVTTTPSILPPLTLQQSIEAFGQSIAASQNTTLNHIYPLPTMTSSFVNVMCPPPSLPTQQQYVSASFNTVPVVGSSSMSLSNLSSSGTTTTARKRGGNNSTFPISEDESDFQKRKSDRNAREQQRAQQVTDQIAHLRDLIVRSGVALDKVDKFSTLIAVEQYIRSLQTKSLELKEEHDNLLATLQKTSELVNSQYVTSVTPPIQVSSGGEESGLAQDSSDPDTDDLSEGDNTTPAPPLLKDMNYKWIFDCCPFATGVAAIDGRFLDCNREFEVMTGYTRAELLPLEQQEQEQNDVSEHDTKPVSVSSPLHTATTQDEMTPPPLTVAPKKTRNMSIFNVLHRECIERLFCAMSTVLQRCNSSEEESSGNNNSGDDYDDQGKCGDTITQEVILCKRSNEKATIRVTLVRSPKGLPRFFNCVLIPLRPT